jgi:hypothetical protein
MDAARNSEQLVCSQAYQSIRHHISENANSHFEISYDLFLLAVIL